MKSISIVNLKGGVGKIFEYTGDGILDLSVPERSTICNMGAELWTLTIRATQAATAA